MGFKFCCSGSSDSLPTPSVPIQPPPALTPQEKDLPALPTASIDGSSSHHLPPQVLEQTKDIHPTTATPDTAPIDLSGEDDNTAVRRQSSFTSPKFEMVSGRTPLGAWHAVAAKVVAANRFRGIGRESVIEDFRIEELGGQNGKLVFGPVAVFNGNVSLRLKKPLKGMTLTVTFNGMAEVDKYIVTFLSISHDVYVGDISEGLRTFLFGFNFPYLNLPPTSRNPQLGYSFTAKLTNTNDTAVGDSASTKSRVSEVKSRPLEIIFIPYVDPYLDSPYIPRTGTKAITKERNGKGKGIESINEKLVNNADLPPNGSGGSLKVAKPKLTLTTADLPSSASSNSTPIIDKPRSLNPSATKSARIKDDDGNTAARLTVELPKTKFLPDDEIMLRLKLTVKDPGSMPKGLGVRVVERRFLARIDHRSDDEESDSDDEERLRDMKVVGRKQSKVLAGKKFTLHPEEAHIVKETQAESSDASNEEDGDEALKGGREIELPIKIRLPAFQTFINDFLLPTSTLPLGSSDVVMNSAPAFGNIDGISDEIYSGKGKGKSPAHSPTVSTPTTATSISMGSANKGLTFVVIHLLQVTVPVSGSGNWFKKSTSTTRDLEVAIPIVLGNINPLAPSRKRMPEFRMNALEEIRYGSGVGSSRSSARRRSSSGSASGAGGPSSSGAGAPSNRVPTWKEGERFLTLKETDVQPFFVKDS